MTLSKENGVDIIIYKIMYLTGARQISKSSLLNSKGACRVSARYKTNKYVKTRLHTISTTKGSHSPHYNRPDPGMEEFITHLLYQGHYARGLHLLTEINQLEPRNLLRFDIYAPCLAICRTYISDSKRYPRFYETGATSGAGTANPPGAHAFTPGF